MATNYSGYNEKQYNNQSAYLNNLINNGTAGQKAWAQNEMNSLNSQYSGSSSSSSSSSSSNKGSSSSSSSGKTSGSSSSSSGKTSSSSSGSYSGGASSSGNSGTNYSGYTQSQYNNQSAYLNGLIAKGGGNAVWAQSELDKLNSQYHGNSTATNSDAVNSGNNAFISPGSQVAEDGTRYHSWGENDQYTRKDYLSGNADLQYALENWMKNNGTNKYDIEAYVKELYGNVGQDRGNGTTVTLADVDKELERLGLSDYNSQNVTHTAGGNLIPNNQYVTSKEGSFGGSNSEDSKWLSYGGQDYLVGGDSANYVDYVNGKTGNTTLLDLLFDNMQNNSYAQQDPEFMAGYNNALNQFNSAAGITGTGSLADALAGAGSTGTTGTTGTNGGYTGNTNVDAVIDYVNSMNNYNQATGSGETVNLLDMIQGFLNSGLQANQDFLAQQRAYAEQQAQKQASDAYVNKVLAGDAAREQMSALGLGTSGALQSALIGVQGNYGNNLSAIQQNLYQMLNSLSEQELQQLSDYYNNMTKYAYQVTNDEADRAMKQAQLALQQQQALYDEQYRQQQLAMQQAQWDWQQQQSAQQYAWEQQQYQDSLAQQEFNNNLAMQELLLKQQAQEFDIQQALKKAAASSTGGGNSGSGNTLVLDTPSGVVAPAGGEVSYPALPIAISPLVTSLTAGNGLIDRLNQEKANQLAGLYQAGDMGAMVSDGIINSGAYDNMMYVDPQLKGIFVDQTKSGITSALQQALNSAGPLEGESMEEYIARMQRMGY